MKTQEKVDDILLSQLTNSSDFIRVDEGTARRWLLFNKYKFSDGKVQFLSIREIGLSVCEVKLRNVGEKNTILVKD